MKKIISLLCIGLLLLANTSSAVIILDGNIPPGCTVSAGTLTCTGFVGDGSGLTGLSSVDNATIDSRIEQKVEGGTFNFSGASYSTVRTDNNQYIKLYEKTSAGNDQLTLGLPASGLDGNGTIDFVNLRTDRIGATFDGGGSPIAVNKTTYTVVPFSATINQWTVVCDQDSGTTGIVIDVLRQHYVEDDITLTSMLATGTKPHTSGGATAGGTSHQANWDGNATLINAGDVLQFKVETAPTSATWCSVTLKVTR